MARPFAALFASRSRWFDLGVLVGGVVLFAYATFQVVADGTTVPPPTLLSIPLIIVIAKFPMILDNGDGGIEVGFDSSILMFLLCYVGPHEAMVIWSLGVLITQITTDKRTNSKIFNVGLGTLGGGVAAGVMTLVGGTDGSARELLAVAVAATCYFATDFLLSAVSVALESGTPLRTHLMQRGTVFAIACFVPFDSLGYLGAVLVRADPKWPILLLAVPLVTLLVATRAVTRGGENARRLNVLFQAAVRAQTLSDARQVVDSLVDDAQDLLRIKQVEVRADPPGVHEIGAQLRDGQRDRWIVAPGQHRARSTTSADQQALEALVAVSSDAFARLRLTEDMTHLARHDLLTNLPNRGLLVDRVEHALQMSRRRGTRISLLFVDLDGFKPVNDRFGHAARRRRVRAAARGCEPDRGQLGLRPDPRSALPGGTRGGPPAVAVGQHRRGVRRQQRDGREHAAQRRPGDVRGQGARQEPVRGVPARDRALPPAAAGARRVAAGVGGRGRPEPGLPTGRARLHRTHRRGRGAGPLEVERGRRTAGRVHPDRRGDRPRGRTR
jgi:hypothetical protein